MYRLHVYTCILVYGTRMREVRTSLYVDVSSSMYVYVFSNAKGHQDVFSRCQGREFYHHAQGMVAGLTSALGSEMLVRTRRPTKCQFAVNKYIEAPMKKYLKRK